MLSIVKRGRPIRCVGDWKKLAPPHGGGRQWAPGRSAFEAARAWCGDGTVPAVPPEITSLLRSHRDVAEAVIDELMPEHRVRFDTLGGEPRNADLSGLAVDARGKIAISVEAKADEPFDRRLSDVLRGAIAKMANDKPTHLVARVQQLAAALLPEHADGLPHLGELRYQLLTAAAGALAQARELGADRAVLVIHEFVTHRTREERHRKNAEDLDSFLCRITAGRCRRLDAGRLLGPIRVPGAPLFPSPAALYVGKARRDTRSITV